MSSVLTSSIIHKWKEQGQFIRFIDGDTRNCSVANLEFVSIKDAMSHIDDWKVDWDMNLTKKEIKLVRNPDWRAKLVFG
tara:strand:+ start:1348 stop:1584 length:237 start_codon:yes stop_codon:yes gene_type:complete